MGYYTLKKIPFYTEWDMTYYSTLHIPFTARGIFFPQTVEQVVEILFFLEERGFPFLVIGKGSNLLFSPKLKEYFFIHTHYLRDFQQLSPEEFFVGAGLAMTQLARLFWEKKRTGFETFYGLPGTLGGALYMNARVYHVEIKDRVKSILVYHYPTQELKSLSVDQVDYGYKKSLFQNREYFILGANLILSPLESEKEEEALQYMRGIFLERKEKGHFAHPSVGSVFKNNYEFGAPSGKLISSLGLCGTKYGGAIISPVHGNIFYNIENATYEDFIGLIQMVQEKVYQEFHVILEPEVELF